MVGPGLMSDPVRPLPGHEGLQHGHALPGEVVLTHHVLQGLQLARDHPELADDIRARRGQLDAAWDALKKTLKDREDSLGEVSKLQTFLQDMDDFQSWLFRTQKAVASEDVPGSLPEAEALLSLHDALRDDIANHREDFLQVTWGWG